MIDLSSGGDTDTSSRPSGPGGEKKMELTATDSDELLYFDSDGGLRAPAPPAERGTMSEAKWKRLKRLEAPAGHPVSLEEARELAASELAAAGGAPSPRD